MFRGIAFDAGPDDDPVCGARRAAYTTLISLTPNTYVIGIDREQNNMLVHELVAGPRDDNPRTGVGQVVNGWLLAALALLIGLVLCGLVCVRGTPMDRLVGLEMAGTVNTLILLVLAEGYHQAIFFDLAVVLALLSFAGGLVFARLLERWL